MFPERKPPRQTICALFLLATQILLHQTQAHADEWNIRPLEIGRPTSGVYPTDINNNGDIIGTFYAAGIEGQNGNQGFLMQNGKVSFYSYPGANETQTPLFMFTGDIVGEYGFPTGERGYFHMSQGLFTRISTLRGLHIASLETDFSKIWFPGSQNTIAYDINAHGHIVGAHLMPNDTYRGFIYRDGQYTTIPNTEAIYAINDHGAMTGTSISYGPILLNPIPEPTTITLAALALLFLLRLPGPRARRV